jgi:hypothetical protein
MQVVVILEGRKESFSIYHLSFLIWSFAEAGVVADLTLQT